MDSQTIRAALGLLQEDPENADGWQLLKDSVGGTEGDLTEEALLQLLDAARQQHRERGEWDAVAHLLELAIGVETDEAKRRELIGDLARMQGDQLLDEAAARVSWELLLDLDDPYAADALEESLEKESKWKELV